MSAATTPKFNTDTDADSQGLAKPKQTARVVLPSVDVDTDEEGGNELQIDEAHEDADFLVDFPDDTQDLELVHARIGSLESLRLPRFAAHLKRLCLRQNFITHLDPDVFRLLNKLEELDFYDNQIKTVGEAFDTLENLKVLDLSFNLLRAVPDGLELLKVLDTIYFVQNKISKITGFTSCISLRSLELGGNKIRKIEGLDSLVNLEELWLGKNKITKLENLEKLTKMKILSLQSNRIVVLEGLENLVNLEQLYLSHNGVKRLEGLDKNVNLTTLDVGSNFVPAMENLSHLKLLEELWMNGNQIPDLFSLESELAQIRTLTTLYLEGNPCQTTDMTGYRRKIMLALPQLKQIDATYVRA